MNPGNAFLCYLLLLPGNTPSLMTSSLSCGFSAEGAATAAWRLMTSLLVWKKSIIVLTVALMAKRTSQSSTKRSRSASRVWKKRQKMREQPWDRHAVPRLSGGSTLPANQHPTVRLSLCVQQHSGCTVGSRAALCEQGFDLQSSKQMAYCSHLPVCQLQHPSQMCYSSSE